MIADRLTKMDVSADTKLDAFMKRCVTNGVRSDEFLHGVAWSTDPAVRAAVVGVFKRAGNIDDLLAASPAVYDKALFAERVGAAIDSLPKNEVGSGDVCGLLSTLTEHAPDLAEPVFKRYLKPNDVGSCRLVCNALRGENVPWDVDLLRPMLADMRTFGWDYAVVDGKIEPRLPIRICDEAAVTLASNHSDFEIPASWDS